MTEQAKNLILEVSLRDVGLWRHHSALSKFFPEKIYINQPFINKKNSIRLGWGLKPSGRRAFRKAQEQSKNCWLIEDGFLRSLGLGFSGAAALSIVVDDIGIYYDSTRPSRLEKIIAEIQLTEQERSDAKRALSLIRHNRLSKYNHAPEVTLAPSNKPRVLVVDQTLNDMSVTLGGANAKTFEEMLRAAIAENPEAEIWVKTHPDVVSGKKRGYLGKTESTQSLHILTQDVSPLFLLEQVEKVYVVTSQMGFEALMLGKKVFCFGLPWYAGWGLCEDHHVRLQELKERRPCTRSLEELFTAAYFKYPRYVNPVTQKPGSIFDVIEWLRINKAAADSTQGEIFCINMTPWKKAIVRPFLDFPGNKIHFVRSLKSLENKALSLQAKLLIWGTKNEKESLAFAKRKNIPLWRMEDGFLRSVGLGSDLYRPLSLVLDKSGIYYDPASQSDLEKMLSTTEFSQGELQEAQEFRKDFASLRLSKYNLKLEPLEIAAQGKKVILVPGQVEDDASIQRGSLQLRTNLQLLEKVRSENPQAFILYKTHPDVAAGNRTGLIVAERLKALADQDVSQANIIDCILASDEVHTLTSLSGFEALLHGRVVHCYGAPFYAGWGLTIDHYAISHRTRKRSLDEVVCAAFLKYPCYIIPGVKGLVSAKNVMNWLAQVSTQQQKHSNTNGLSGWIARKKRKSAALIQLLREELYSGK